VTIGLAKAELKPEGPDQWYVASVVVDVPERFLEGFEQVSIPVTLADIPNGKALFCTTGILRVSKHPLAVLVIVTLYVPAVCTKGDCKVDVKEPGPLQL
jgi:hypothetical protein